MGPGRWGSSDPWLGIPVSLPAVLVYAGALGTEGEFYKWMRRYGVVFYFGFTGIAQLLVANRLFWPAVLKYLYCRHARGMVAYLNRMSPTFASDIDIATRGGTSRTSVLAGLIAGSVVMILTWNVIDVLHAALVEPVRAFAEPPPLAPAPARPAVPDPEVDLLATENKWVATRNRLRVFGQQVNAWLVDAGPSVDPAGLDIDRIAAALSAGEERITDGWGNKIGYESDGVGYRLVSAGPDGEGTGLGARAPPPRGHALPPAGLAGTTRGRQPCPPHRQPAGHAGDS